MNIFALFPETIFKRISARITIFVDRSVPKWNAVFVRRRQKFCLRLRDECAIMRSARIERRAERVFHGDLYHSKQAASGADFGCRRRTDVDSNR